ncbi:MAG: PepSY-associated TM helix domain-containing protein [Hyphomicrobiaceae bacterium]|nr:PepSY-associated TM helix domain-containing protein [Hyphomicrobiaceae bacterium]
MSFLDQKKTKRLFAIHGWSGIALGVLLYVIVLTGAVAVFAHEIGVWSVGGAANDKGLTQPVDRIIRGLADKVDPKYRDDVGAYTVESGALSVFFHTHETKPNGDIGDRGVRFLVDPATGSVLSRAEGWSSDIYGQDQASALKRFLIDLHVQLYLPSPWGLILTGILGLAMMVAATSGLIMHRHILKDIFVAPRPGNLLLHARDRHVLAGTWGLPFAFLLAFTGSFLSFAFTIGMPIVSMSAFGGDKMLVGEILGGHAQTEDKTPAVVTNLDAVLADGQQRAGSAPTYIHVGHWGRADAKVGVWFEPPAGDLGFLQLGFNGVSGAFEGQKPRVGSKPSFGATASSVLTALHYGLFAGLLSKIIWLSLGLASCYVILTGMVMWFTRRREDPAWAPWTRMVPAIGYGLPLAMLVSAHFYFQAIGRSDTATWTPWGFALATLAVIAAAVAMSDRVELTRRLVLATAISAGLLPLARMMAGGRSWGEAVAIGEPVVVSIDLLLLIAAAALTWHWKGSPQPQWLRRRLAAAAQPEPAE